LLIITFAMNQHRDIIKNCLQKIGFILHRQFGQPVHEESRLYPTDFVLVGRYDRKLIVRVGSVCENYTVNKVRDLFDRNMSMYGYIDLNGFFLIGLSRIADDVLSFDIVRAENGDESICVTQDGEEIAFSNTVRKTYGDNVQPGWGCFPHGACYLLTS